MVTLKRIQVIFLPLLLVWQAQALEPLKDSTDLYLETRAQLQLANLDNNQDGEIQKAEDEKHWKRNARYDENKDGSLDLEELKRIPIAYVDSPGRQLHNVLFKRTLKGGVYFDFYFPDEDTSSRKPVVIFTHGGGWVAGDKSKAGVRSFNEIHRALLREGFCVLSVEYRLASDGSTMRDCVIDSKDALRYISAYRKELGIDPKRIYTFGDSAGGHLAQMILLSPPGSLKGDPELARYKYRTVAGVSWYGPCDFQDMRCFNYEEKEPSNDRFNDRILGGSVSLEEKRQRYSEMSPVKFLRKNGPALLMMQGDKDTTIPVKQAYRMQEALKSIDAPVEIVVVKNSGHNWKPVEGDISPSREEIVERTILFLVNHL